MAPAEVYFCPGAYAFWERASLSVTPPCMWGPAAEQKSCDLNPEDSRHLCPGLRLHGNLQAKVILNPLPCFS